MPILQPLIDLAAVCHAHGVRHVIISPGSRSAALTLAFVRHGGFQTHVYMDERSAGFVGMGIAQQLKAPVVLICTSGSAAYNFAPSVAEAFFQQIPLLVLTADRPKEWLHQYDGQTIFQAEIYGKHVKRSFELPTDYVHQDSVWAINRIINEACATATFQPAGPVHINVPIREPFYPKPDETFTASPEVRIVRWNQSDAVIGNDLWSVLIDEFQASERILIAGGQYGPEPDLSAILGEISDEWEIPVLVDSIANLDSKEQFVKNHDLFLGQDDSELRPDLLITFGLSFISKPFKQFLRKYQPKQHWHVSGDDILADPTQSITRKIDINPLPFFQQLFERIDYQLFVENSELDNDTSYIATWASKDRLAAAERSRYLLNLSKVNDITSLDFIFRYTDSDFQLHIANSMAIRYFNALRPGHFQGGIYCNRGTSGIDGCVSTAVGAAKVNNMPTMLIVGDVAFLYDRNALLSSALPANLKIVVLNNGGGNIFRMIDGPGQLPELEAFFETQHSFSARNTCADSGIAYFRAASMTELHEVIRPFIDKTGISLLEIFTSPVENKKVWIELKKATQTSA